MKRETYEHRPWLEMYSPHVPPDLQPSVRSSLEHLAAAVASSPRAPCIAYFGTVLDFATVDALSSALAVGLSKRGVKRGDRVAVPFSMLASDSGTPAGDQRYAFLIAPQVAPCVERAGVGLEPLPTILLEVGAPGLPITEQRYISFVAVSVISPLAAAAAISSSEKS